MNKLRYGGIDTESQSYMDKECNKYVNNLKYDARRGRKGIEAGKQFRQGFVAAREGNDTIPGALRTEGYVAGYNSCQSYVLSNPQGLNLKI